MIRKIGKCLIHPHNFATTIIHNQYNFFVDFKGLLYFDDSTPFIYPNCIKDKKFIDQLYNKLVASPNPQDKYPYLAEFWGEKNHVRSAISPVIFNSLLENRIRFSFEQAIDFKPEALQIDGQGRIWHPFREKIKGVFSNDLLVSVMDHIEIKNEQVSLFYEGKKHSITKIENQNKP